MKDISWYKAKHKMMWNEIIIELSDTDSYFFKNNLSLSGLKRHVWKRISEYKETIPAYTCYACHYALFQRRADDFDKCTYCPIAKNCGRCVEEDSVFNKLEKLINEEDTADIEKAIEYCKAIRDGWN